MTENQVASGASDGQVSDPPKETSAEQNNYVSYDTHRRLLSEKKKRDEQVAQLSARLAEFESEREAAEKAELEKQGKFKEMVDIEKKRAAELEARLNDAVTQHSNLYKLAAFNKALDGKIGGQYLDILQPIIVPRIQMDESGNIDEMSVTETVKFVKDTYPAFISTPATTTGLPTSSPKGSSQDQITYQQWLDITDVNEKKKRIKDVIRE